MKIPTRLVLFDLDGTLVDSIRLFRDSLSAILSTYRVELNEPYFWHWHANRIAWPDLFDRHGLSQIVEDPFKLAVVDEYAKRINAAVAWNEGALETLLSLKSLGLSIGVVTNAPSAHVELIDSKLGLKGYLDVLIAAEDIGRRKKPEPFGLLLAAQKLNVPPAQGIYIGDQLFDMQAARQAGMRGVLYKTAEAVDASGLATTVIGSLREVVELLG